MSRSGKGGEYREVGGKKEKLDTHEVEAEEVREEQQWRQRWKNIRIWRN